MHDDRSLARHTTLKVGGKAARLEEVTSVTDLPGVLATTANDPVPPLILGSGSNVLIPDAGYPGTVILINNKGITYTPAENDTVLVTAAAGELLDELVEVTAQQALWGLENLSAIPGTVGATPIQNVGAYGVEVSDLITQVVATSQSTREEHVFNNGDCQFGYRNSYFKTAAGREWVITSVTFSLSTRPQPQLSYGTLGNLATETKLTPTRVREEITAIRSEKFPDWHTVGTAGSFFKNPIITADHYTELQQKYPELPGYAIADRVKVPLGYVLDKICGLRGYQEGNVRLYEKQALVLVANAGATASEITAFAAKVAAIVKTKTAISIEPEVTFV